MGNRGFFGFTRRDGLPVAFGGTEISVNVSGLVYKTHTFLASATLTLVTPGVVDVLIVGGGGAGANGLSNQGQGGGGAGGYVSMVSLPLVAGEYPIVVGGNGQNTTFSDFIALAGGLATAAQNGADGGNGTGTGYAKLGGKGLQNQGKNGGVGVDSAGWQAGGGGGGYSANGSNASDVNNPGAGGTGIANTISGASVTYSTGGAGGARAGGAGAAGAANTGNGGVGGGGSGGGSAGGAGGSGIVIVRYRIG